MLFVYPHSESCECKAALTQINTATCVAAAGRVSRYIPPNTYVPASCVIYPGLWYARDHTSRPTAPLERRGGSPRAVGREGGGPTEKEGTDESRGSGEVQEEWQRRVEMKW